MSAFTMLLNFLCNSSCLDKHSSHYLPTEQRTKVFTDYSSKQLIFKFSEKFLWGGHTVIDCRDELQVLISGQKSREQVASTKINITPVFDTRDEDAFRNIRRCSLAPLGDSYLIKQFELDPRSGRHFKHVIKIEPRKTLTDEKLLPQPPPNLADLLQVPLED